MFKFPYIGCHWRSADRSELLREKLNSLNSVQRNAARCAHKFAWGQELETYLNFSPTSGIGTQAIQQCQLLTHICACQTDHATDAAPESTDESQYIRHLALFVSQARMQEGGSRVFRCTPFLFYARVFLHYSQLFACT